MTAEPLLRVLEGTGYLLDGEPAPGVRLGSPVVRRYAGRRNLRPDASWQGSSGLRVYFKFAHETPDALTVSSWHREVWNEGFAPLLWVVSPARVDLYNGFGRPVSAADAAEHRVRAFEGIDEHLAELDSFAGRLAMETGQFWRHSDQVTRKTGVDEQLLTDLAAVEQALVNLLPRAEAQGLIGRAIFTQYLVDRAILSSPRLQEVCGEDSLPDALRNSQAARDLFDWLSKVFNGDMFPETNPESIAPPRALARLADFLEAVDPETGQTTFFPYQFDVIPVELISSIYEQFAHSADDDGGNDGSTPGTEARNRGVHYTRLPVVSLVLDEVLQGTSGDETVLDLTCGSGVFLVEALRRLVWQKAGDSPPREVIRRVLYEQVFGVDISESAIRVAAFSLYLAALELDPNPEPPEALRFQHIVGRTLLVGDAAKIAGSGETPLHDDNGEPRRFDVIVGNPPWTFRGKKGTAERRQRGESGRPTAPRGEAFDFLSLARRFASNSTRFGMVLSASPFFAASETGAAAAAAALEGLTPLTLVHLGALRQWLFPKAKMPAMLLLAGHRSAPQDEITVVEVPWSPLAEKSYTFEIAPSDVSTLRRTEWDNDPDRLKAAMFGRGRDIALLDEVRGAHSRLDSWLDSIGAEWRDGLILGKTENRTRDASFLQGLDLLGARDLRHFRIPAELPKFTHEKAQWPRQPEIYQAPVLLVKEFFRGGPRPVAAVAERDIAYTDAYFGAALPESELLSAKLLAGILSSALSAWYFLLTGSEFAVWKQRLLTADVGSLPIVDLDGAVHTDAGKRLLRIEHGLQQRAPKEGDWVELDEAVFDLYKLTPAAQLVVRDGLARAGWQWRSGRKRSVAPANVASDLQAYAGAFLGAIDQWLQATGRRSISAEIFALPQAAPLRVVRFCLRQGRRPPKITVVEADEGLEEILRRIGDRLNVRIGSALMGERELRVHGADEVVVIKPAARRFWLPAKGLTDADAVVSESFAGAPV